MATTVTQDANTTNSQSDNAKEIPKDIDLVRKHKKLKKDMNKITTVLVKIREDVNLLKKKNDHTVIESFGHGVFLGFKIFLLVGLLKLIITY
jgi:hypothetical protein